MELQIGDKIKVDHPFNKQIVEIERVTKTQAITKPYNDAGARYTFDRETLTDNSVRKIKKDRSKWDTTEYTLIKTK